MVLDGSNSSRYSTKRSCRFFPSKSSSDSPNTHTNLVTRDAKTLAHLSLNGYLLWLCTETEVPKENGGPIGNTLSQKWVLLHNSLHFWSMLLFWIFYCDSLVLLSSMSRFLLWSPFSDETPVFLWDPRFSWDPRFRSEPSFLYNWWLGYQDLPKIVRHCQNTTHLYISNTLCGRDDFQFVVLVRNNNTLMTFEIEVLLTAHSNLNQIIAYVQISEFLILACFFSLLYHEQALII